MWWPCPFHPNFVVFVGIYLIDATALKYPALAEPFFDSELNEPSPVTGNNCLIPTSMRYREAWDNSICFKLPQWPPSVKTE